MWFFSFKGNEQLGLHALLFLMFDTCVSVHACVHVYV